MSAEAWIGLVGVAFAAVALAITTWIGVRQIMVSTSTPPTVSNTEIIRAILTDAKQREETSDLRAWEFVGETLDRLQHDITECEKGRRVMERRIAECEEDRKRMLHRDLATDITTETPGG